MPRLMPQRACSPVLAAIMLPLLSAPLWAADPPGAARPGRLTMTTLERPADEEIEPRRTPRPVQRGPKKPLAVARGEGRGQAPDRAAAEAASAPAMKAQAIGRGVQYLIGSQRNDGGWNSGEQWNGPMAADLSNTSIAGLAVLRAGTAVALRGEEEAVERAVRFVTGRVEASADAELWAPRPDVVDGTVQRDLGVGVDAVLAALFLAESVEAAGADRQAATAKKSLNTLMRVITRNVREQPNAFAAGGQALTRGLIAHAVDRATRVGVEVDDDLVPLITANGPKNMGLYGDAGRVGCLHVAWRRSGGGSSHAFAQIADEAASAAPVAAGPVDTARELEALGKSLVEPVLANPRNQWPYGAGGEVFLALMFLTAMLQDTNADVAAAWTARVDAQLIQTQNAQGSWTGSSCINSRVFCTSSALLVMVPTRDGAAVAGR